MTILGVLGTLFTNTDFADPTPMSASPPQRPGGSPSAPSSSSPRTSPIAKPPTPSGPAGLEVRAKPETGDPSFDFSVLPESRQRLLDGAAEERLLWSDAGAVQGEEAIELPLPLVVVQWKREVAACLEEKQARHGHRYGKPARREKDRVTIPMIQVHFHEEDCAACSSARR